MKTALQEWFDSKRHTDDEYHERCEAAHPNHEYMYACDGQPRFWTAWCRICDREGHNAEDAGMPHPEMSAEHLAKAMELAAADEARSTTRQKKPRCICPDCGAEHIKKENRP